MTIVYALLSLAVGVGLLFFGGRAVSTNKAVGFVATALGMFFVAFSLMVLYLAAVPLIDNMLA